MIGDEQGAADVATIPPWAVPGGPPYWRLMMLGETPPSSLKDRTRSPTGWPGPQPKQ